MQSSELFYLAAKTAIYGGVVLKAAKYIYREKEWEEKGDDAVVIYIY